MKLNCDISGPRRLAVAVVLLTLICGAPSLAWCASANLWVSDVSGKSTIASYTSGQLKKSGMPAPIQLTTFGDVTGLAFDKSHNLWAVAENYEVVEFTAAQLKNLKKDPSPTPAVIITSTSTFKDLYGCNFDPQGNLWIVDFETDSIDELSKAQLAGGSADVTPAIVISSKFDLFFDAFVTFDTDGNAWVDSQDDKIFEFSANQLTSGGDKSPTVVLSDDGSGTSLDNPGEIVFDKKGNLWVANIDSNTVVEYAKAQLTETGNPAPTVKLNSAIFDEPWGAAFNSKGNLFVMDYLSGTIAEFTAKQLKTSGAPVPKVTVMGTEFENDQIIFGPAF